MAEGRATFAKMATIITLSAHFVIVTHVEPNPEFAIKRMVGVCVRKDTAAPDVISVSMGITGFQIAGLATVA